MIDSNAAEYVSFKYCAYYKQKILYDLNNLKKYFKDSTASFLNLHMPPMIQYCSFRSTTLY